MRKILLTGVVLCLTVALGGCVTPTPEPTPKAEAPSPPPSAIAEPEATSIVVGGTEMSIEFDDNSSETFAYSSEPNTAIAALTEAFGVEPVVTDVPEKSCGSAETTNAWDDFVIFSDSGYLPDGQLFGARVSGSTPLPVEASDGSVLGEDNTAVFEATDDRHKDQWESEGVVNTRTFFDLQDFEDGDILYQENPATDAIAWGGATDAKDGIVWRIGAPYPFKDC